MLPLLTHSCHTPITTYTPAICACGARHSAVALADVCVASHVTRTRANTYTIARSSSRLSFSLATVERGVLQTRIVRLPTEEAPPMTHLYWCTFVCGATRCESTRILGKSVCVRVCACSCFCMCVRAHVRLHRVRLCMCVCVYVTVCICDNHIHPRT